MDESVIVIDDSDTEVPDASSCHREDSSQPSTSAASRNTRSQHKTQHQRANVSPRRPPSDFQRKRKQDELNSHPVAKRGGYALRSLHQAKHPKDIPIDRHSVVIAKKSEPSKASQQRQKRLNQQRQKRSNQQRQTRLNQQRLKNALLSTTNSGDDGLIEILPFHRQQIRRAKKAEARRKSLGLPKSRLRIPTEKDPESAHREFFVKSIEAEKIEQDIKNGYIVRVEERHSIQLDDLDPELLTGRPLTEKEAYWVKKKQARRAGPRSSSWPSVVPMHDQHTEYISLTEKARNIFDPNAEDCSECGSKLWGTSILYPLSRPAGSRPPPCVINKDAPLCIGCSRLFSCVKDRSEKLNMIHWIITGKTLDPMPCSQNDGTLMNLCRRRLTAMKIRACKHYSELPSNFVTAEQLFEDVKRDNYNCYLIGSPMRLESGYFNSLTFDHVFPISIAMMMPNCWSVENFQPMSYCMNQVKGNEANTEAKRWLINFKTHYYKADFK
ncbi:hypothetical protein HMPREF1544_09653 [Mucor circinelloides 1006PhL]|uniref:Uncharacterized protein n=1 Tax=Mucor circinelloides f. circinelloides (strain 1006PhL) TaxID=1220926 RepID=S2JUX6_MUCC1|nr:hypothetical protein HMPREF1544_09653 [Mucor circinelloides 1006PhL]KAG1112561.1 hypothetical protein G6F42_014707 [Rhizopus arrhizus]